MTIAQDIIDDNVTSNGWVIDENELMADAADLCISCKVWIDEYGYNNGNYYFADGSVLNVNPCGPEAYIPKF